MRRSGQYGDPGGKAYVPAQMQHMSGQRVEQKSNNYQGRQESMTSDKEHPYGAPRGDGHWRWERDGSSHMFNEGKLCIMKRFFFLLSIFLLNVSFWLSNCCTLWARLLRRQVEPRRPYTLKLTSRKKSITPDVHIFFLKNIWWPWPCLAYLIFRHNNLFFWKRYVNVYNIFFFFLKINDLFLQIKNIKDLLHMLY